MGHCKSSLSASRQRLLQAMQRNPFSNIEIVIRQGEPSFNPPPRITREIKLGMDAPVRGSADENDFQVKRAVTDLFQHLDRVPDDSVVKIEVRHGLPARLILAGEA